MRFGIQIVAAALLLLAALIGCSASMKDAITPDSTPPVILGSGATPESAPSHPEFISGSHLWGIYQFSFNGTTFEIVPLRQADLHFNVVPLIETGGETKVSIESGIEVSGPNNNIITLDIGLSHPFTGMTEYRGFDVKGIFFGSGYYIDSVPTELLPLHEGGNPDKYQYWEVCAGPKLLMNTDGYTDYWNPIIWSEDPVGWTPESPVFSYVNGILGSPTFSCGSTAHPFKLFASGLSATESIIGLLDSDRLSFPAGAKLIREYQIDFIDDVFTNPVIFNYAVDASWEPPTSGSPPYSVSDFPLAANQPEPVIRSLGISNNTLTTTGGSVDVTASAYDHQGGPLTVEVIAPAIASGRIPLSESGSEWSGTISNYLGGEAGEIPFWVVVTDSEGNYSFTRTLVSVTAGANAWSDQNLILADDPNFSPLDPKCIYDSTGQLHVMAVKNWPQPTPDQLIYWRSGEGIVHILDISPSLVELYDPDIIPYGSNLLVIFTHSSVSGAQLYYALVDPLSPPATLNTTQYATPGEANTPLLAQSATETRFTWNDLRSGSAIYGETYPLSGEVEIAKISNYGCWNSGFAANSTDFYLAWYSPSSTNPNRVYFQDGFTGERTMLIEGNSLAGSPHLGCTDTHICAAWGPYFQEWEISTGPIPYPEDGCYQVLLDDGGVRGMLYDKDGNGMIFYGHDYIIALAYIPSANPVLPVGDITEYWHAGGGFGDQAICDTEVAVVYCDPDHNLCYRTAPL